MLLTKENTTVPIPWAKHLKVPVKGSERTSGVLWKDCSSATRWSFSALSTFNLSGKTQWKRKNSVFSVQCIQQAGEGEHVRRLVPHTGIFDKKWNMLPIFLLNYYCSPLSDHRSSGVTMNDLTQEQSPENTQSSSSGGYRNTNKQQWEERKDLLFLRSFTKQ